MNSNLSVKSNLMLDDEQHRPQYRYIPGDYIGKIYRQLVDVRVYESALTKQQIIELEQYLVCVRCHRPCAGTCGR
jgi:hypothetical protein